MAYNIAKRNPIYDIIKGFLIILVIYGHIVDVNDTLSHNLIFSFHMPAFFMLTGMLSHWGVDNKSFIKKRFNAYVVPYFTWSFMVFLAFWPESPLKFCLRTIYGGALNTTHYTYQFWFICALFVSSVIYNFLRRFKQIYTMTFIAFFMLIWYTLLFDINIYPLPWSIEVTPFIMLYFILGEKIKYALSISNKVKTIMYCLCTIISILIVIMWILGINQYALNMKNAQFYCFPLDIIYPLVFYVFIEFLCSLFNKVAFIRNIFVYLGRSSLVIMFTHVSVLYIYRTKIIQYFNFYHDWNNIIGTVLSIVIGCLLYSILSTTKSTRLLFLGKNT